MLPIYKINYEQIIDDTSIPSCIRILAGKLAINPSMLISTFFENLSDQDVDDLRIFVEDESDSSMSILLLLTMMLSAAEGTSAISDEEITDYTAFTRVFISTTALHHKGLVTAIYKNFSYGEDMRDARIAEPTDFGIEYAKQLKDKNDDEQ